MDRYKNLENLSKLSWYPVLPPKSSSFYPIFQRHLNLSNNNKLTGSLMDGVELLTFGRLNILNRSIHDSIAFMILKFCDLQTTHLLDLFLVGF